MSPISLPIESLDAAASVLRENIYSVLNIYTCGAGCWLDLTPVAGFKLDGGWF